MKKIEMTKRKHTIEKAKAKYSMHLRTNHVVLFKLFIYESILCGFSPKLGAELTTLFQIAFL